MNKQGQLESEQSGRHRNNTGVEMNMNTNSRGRTGTQPKSKSPMRQNNKSRSPMRQQQNRQQNNNNKSRSPTRRHYNNKSKSPTRRGGGAIREKKPAAMTVIVNRCDLWDSAAHFQPDEFFQPQTQHSVVHALPYRFADANGDPPTSQVSVDEITAPTPPPPPGIEKRGEAQQSMSVATARVPHHVESMQFPIRAEGTHRSDVIDTTIPNPHDPNVVHNKYWAQRR